MNLAPLLKAFVLTLSLFSTIIPATSQAQFAINPGVDRIAPGLHISARIGVGYYGGDLDAVNTETENTKRSLALDLLWYATPKIGLVASVQQSNYSRIVDPLDLTSTILMLRYTPFTGRISPYVQGGFHRTYGGVETGTGPAGGLGISLAITPKIHFFQEVNANFVGPDLAIDNTEGGSGFDILGFLGGGIRVANIGVKYHKRAKIDRLVYPSEIRSNMPVEFMAKIDKKASQPVVVTWDFGDGVVAKGNPILHAFPHAGVFKVKVFAENSGGTDMKDAEITVLHGMDRPVIANTQGVTAQSIFIPDNASPEQAYEMAVMSVEEAERALENAKRILAITQANLENADIDNAEPEMAAAEGSDGPQPDLTEKEEPAMMKDPSELEVIKVEPSESVEIEEVVDPKSEKAIDPDEAPLVAVVLGQEKVEEMEDSAKEESEVYSGESENATDFDFSDLGSEEDEVEKVAEPAEEETEEVTMPVVVEVAPDVQPSLEEQSDESEYFVRLDQGWSIVVASKLGFAEARNVMSSFLEEGYNCEIMPAKSGDKVVYRVTVGQYEDRPEADRMRSEFFKFGVPSDAWLYEFDRSDFSTLWEQE